MNIILFVSALVMALSILTYGKWEAFRNLYVVESQFRNYMEKSERSAINQAADLWYLTTTVSRGGAGGGGRTTQASARLSFKPFIDKAAQDKVQKEFPQIQYLAKKLIYVLYAQAPFYKQLFREDPQFVDHLLASLMVADSFPTGKKLQSAKELSSLHLPNPVLDDILYKIMKGAPDPDLRPIPIPLNLAEEEDQDPDPDLEEEYYSPVGYYSLLDYITLQPATKVRVFLASKPLLTAIFDHAATVEEVIQERQRLYAAVMSNSIQATEASKQFQSAFLHRADRSLNSSVLDFTITKTNPKHYE